MTTEPSQDSSAIERGSRIGRFVVVAELGSGGMGAVYAAHDPQLDRQVALKVMHGAVQDDADRVRMLREGQAMARVTHPNVITVYEVGTAGDLVFLAQELLDGGTLSRWLDAPRTLDEIIEKFAAAGRGLAAAHAAGLVHRDFKPDNVLLGTDGRVRVADFGLARQIGGATPTEIQVTARGGGPPTADLTSPMSPLTRTGAVMGTPMFMAPEQHLGERADARSDQFGFCVALYHALYGSWPFAGKTSVALADAVIHGRRERPRSGKNVPARLRALIDRGLAVDPAARYPSMHALLADLVGRPSRTGARIAMVASALLVAGGAAVGGYVLTRPEPSPSPIATPTKPTNLTAQPPALTTEKGMEWLTAAIDRGQLGDAIEKYDMAAALAEQNGDKVAGAIAEAASAFVHVVRGDLPAADKVLARAKGHAGSEAIATAYVDLATAALAGARGDLRAAQKHGELCARGFAGPAPTLAAMCHQLIGDALADRGDVGGARAAYGEGMALARRHKSVERSDAIGLALAQLDLDDGKPTPAAATATEAQSTCNGRGAIGCEVHARVLLARIRLEQADSDWQEALKLLDPVVPSRIESFRIRLGYAIELGKVHGYMNETTDDDVSGLARIEKARTEAERHGFRGLVLEARLAHVRVLLTQTLPDAQTALASLTADARKQGFDRIARLAETAASDLRIEPPPPQE